LGVFEAIGSRGHEEIIFSNDPASGLRSIIAIHSTALGPALGGTRFYPYSTEEEALEDVLRLSMGMTMKAAAAGLDLGGGKAVIIGDPRTKKSERLWRAFGRAVDSLGGRYITAEDVGTDTNDMNMVRRETRWVVGIGVEEGGSDDPSPFTARGVFASMRAVSRFLWETDDLAGRTVAVMGVGKVGSSLVDRLVEAGVRVLVCDTYPPALEETKARHPAVEIVPGEKICSAECDIFSPNSLGAVLNEESIARLRCAAVCGAANNQLATDDDAKRLMSRGILYAPDFVANAGGLINVSDEIRGYNVERATARVERIYDNTLRVLHAAHERNMSPHHAAVELAQERVAGIGSLRLFRRCAGGRA
jgi:glutamate dehydrogenase/leucine dehydrogenase